MSRMKSALSLALIAGFATMALPVAAQEPAATREVFDLRHGLASQGPAGPLARAVTREAVRLAADGASPAAEAVQAGKRSGTSDWSRVGTLARGTEIIVTVKGSTPVRRYLIAADESGLTILNLAAVGLQFTAARVLRDMASHHPEDLQAAQTGKTVDQESVRVAPDGVFLAGGKVADLGQVVENIARTDVAEINTLPTPFWSSVHRHAKIGLGVGAVVGLVAGLSSRSYECGSGCVPAFGLVGGLMGAEIGAFNGAVLGAITHKIQHVIYRAP